MRSAPTAPEAPVTRTCTSEQDDVELPRRMDAEDRALLDVRRPARAAHEDDVARRAAFPFEEPGKRRGEVGHERVGSQEGDLALGQEAARARPPGPVGEGDRAAL